VRAVTDSVCGLALDFGEKEEGRSGKKKMGRPFGTSLLVAGYEDGKCEMYHTDPSGTYTQCRARAIGGGAEGAETMLRDGYHDGMTMEETEDLALTTLR
jgi:20S proteasome subunit alpha 5